MIIIFNWNKIKKIYKMHIFRGNIWIYNCIGNDCSYRNFTMQLWLHSKNFITTISNGKENSTKVIRCNIVLPLEGLKGWIKRMD